MFKEFIIPNFSKEINEDSLFRCGKCNTIPLIGLNIEKEKLYIESKCENSHYDKVELSQFVKNLDLIKLTCKNCSKQSNNIFYCVEDNQFYCFNCRKNIFDNSIHTFLDIKDFDSKCKIHNKDYNSFCDICNKNKCLYCSCPHNKENVNNLHNNYLINKNEINQMKNNIQELKEFISQTQKEAQNIYKEINNLFLRNLKEFNEKNNLLIQLCEKVISCYEIHDITKSLNYQIIKNVWNILQFKSINNKLSFEEYFDLKNYIVLEDSKLNLNELNEKKEDNNFIINKEIKDEIDLNKLKSLYNNLESKNKIKFNKETKEEDLISNQKNILTIKIQTPSDSFSNENKINENENENEINEINEIKVIQAQFPLILKLKTTNEKNEELFKKISYQICKLKEIIVDKNIIQNLFKEYPKKNLFKEKEKENINIKIVYNKKNKKNKKLEYIYSGEINTITKEKEGRGILIYKNGDYRIGYFHKDLQVEKGIFFLKEEESFYEGNFKNNNQEGYGELYWNDKEYFFGEFIDSEMHKGTFYYKDGSIYNGYFKNGKKNGIGNYFNPKTKIWENNIEFKNDKIYKQKKVLKKKI